MSFLNLSPTLGAVVASTVYENMRQRGIHLRPMRPWEALTDDERAQIIRGLNLWLKGLGSNEVAQAWFERSGSFVGPIVEQLQQDYDRTMFTFAAMDLINELIKLAEQGVDQQGEQKHESHQ